MAPKRRASAKGQQALGGEPIDVEAFFESKKAAAVLKHEILKGYVPPFAGKTGFRSPDHKVVIMDGFAGAGRYGDGSAGSPAIFIDAARATPSRKFLCYFVEKDKGNYTALRSMLEAEGEPITWEAWHGTAGAHMSEVLTRADGLPLFMFIDPYGIGPDFAQVVEIFQRRPGGLGTPATELLFRVDASALRRILGVYRSTTEFPAREAQIRKLDTVAGGPWWGDEDDGVRTGAVFLEWFFEQYLKRLCTAIRCAGWATDVKQKPHHQPAYYLVFLTRHPDGMEKFGEALSLALVHWRRTVFFEAVEAQQAKTGQFALMDPQEQFNEDERLLAAAWHSEIEQNVRALLREHERFRVRDQLETVFGTAMGQARSMHLRKALDKLRRDGVTESDKKGDLYDKVIIRAPAAQP